MHHLHSVRGAPIIIIVVVIIIYYLLTSAWKHEVNLILESTADMPTITMCFVDKWHKKKCANNQVITWLSSDLNSSQFSVIRSKAAQARIVQTQKKVVVTSALNRTFGRAQWLQLKEKLSVWQLHLQKASTDVGSTTFDRIWVVEGSPVLQT